VSDVPGIVFLVFPEPVELVGVPVVWYLPAKQFTGVVAGQRLLEVLRREVVADVHVYFGLQVVAPSTTVHLVHTVPSLSLK